MDSSLRFISGAYAGLDATVFPRARIASESLKANYNSQGISLPEINSGAEPGSPPSFNDFRMMPYALQPGENLELQTVNNPAAAADQYGVLFMSDGKIQPVDPTGGFWTRWTTTASAATAKTWNSRSLTPDSNLPVGTYDVLGGWAESTSLIATRLSFPNQVAKPGWLGADAVTDIPHQSFRYPGQWGVLGRFHSQNPPAVELLVGAADNEVQDVRLFLRRVG